LYKEKGEFVFADSTWDDVRDLGLAIGAQYGNENLGQALTEQFGDQTLGELSKKVLVSTFDLDNEATEPGQIRTWKAKFFHNYPGPDSDGGESMVDVAIRTSAAPVYFPVYQGYIDGGVVANNPSMCALAQALHGSTGGQRLQDIALLSLGTGRTPVYLEAENADWGWVQWAKDLRLIGVMLDGSIGLADYQCRQVLDEQYHRLNPSLPTNITMDDVQEIPVLEQVADEADLTATIDWLVQYF
jgi:patatin-like phospholipase/acyl hydrolase